MAKLGQIDLAKEHFIKVIAEVENHADSYYNLGVIETFKEEYKKAREYFQKALQYHPNHVLAANGLKQLEQIEKDNEA